MSPRSHLSPDNLLHFLQVKGTPASANDIANALQLGKGDRRQLFGVGTALRIDRLTVTWPSGLSQEWRNLPVDRYLRLAEGESTPQTLP